MHITITLPDLPAGYAVTNAPAGGAVVIETAGYMTSAEGQEFIRRLERATHPFFVEMQRMSGDLVNVAEIVSLVAVIRRDHTAVVYINEPPIEIEVQAHEPAKAGDLVGVDDIADIRRVRFPGISIAPDAGVVAVFSHGWRRAVYFNYAALPVGARPNSEEELARDMARCMRRLLYEERFSITDAEWSKLLSAGLFPFVGLSDGVINRMLTHAQAGHPLNEIVPEICAEVKERVGLLTAPWRSHPAFVDHNVILERAVERHVAGDYVCATGLLYPRIEGVLRSGMTVVGATGRVSQSTMSASATAGVAERVLSLLHPEHFERFLREVYFASFNPGGASIPVARNSVSHGVASADAFGETASALAILVLHHLAAAIPRSFAGAGSAP